MSYIFTIFCFHFTIILFYPIADQETFYWFVVQEQIHFFKTMNLCELTKGSTIKNSFLNREHSLWKIRQKLSRFDYCVLPLKNMKFQYVYSLLCLASVLVRIIVINGVRQKHQVFDIRNHGVSRSHHSEPKEHESSDQVGSISPVLLETKNHMAAVQLFLCVL